MTIVTQDWEGIFDTWAQPPSKTEVQRSENAIRSIHNAISHSSKLNQQRLKVFTQGSYRNRVNVRRDSDVDIGVMLYQYFLWQIPEGKTPNDYGIRIADYTFAQFKDDLEDALVAHFGRAAVTRGNKAFNIRENSYHVEADVVPLFEFRRYWEDGHYRAGVALLTDKDSRRIENFPERLVDYWPSTPLHYENGVTKNDETVRRFKGIVRILKSLRNTMDDAGSQSAKAIPGYLLECMTWNVPNTCFSGSTWDTRVQAVLRHLWISTNDATKCKSWCEVDAIKYLFRSSQPWTREAAHTFINEAWTFVGVRSS